MANTYTQIHIHAVFAVQNRDAVINSKLERRIIQVHYRHNSSPGT